jgi:DNA-binding beta-propeller fold protein YncE
MLLRNRVAMTFVLLLALVAATPATRQVTRRIPIPGEGGWDYLAVDAPTHRLFVTHSTRVDVVDLKRGTVIGHVDSTLGVHGVAFAHDLGRGYTSNGRDSTITIFDLKTLATIARVPIPGRFPDTIVYDPASHRVFALCGGSSSAVVLDGRNGKVVGSVPLGGRPEFAVVDEDGRLFVNLEDSSAVVAFDTRSLEAKARWPLAPGEEPSGLAIDRAHHRLFSACANKTLVVLDATSGARVATLPIGSGVDAAAFDSKRRLVYSSNGEGTLTVIREDDPNHYHVDQTVTTERGARTCALDPGTGILYTVTAEFGPPPAPTPERPHPRGPMVPGSFRVLAIAP